MNASLPLDIIIAVEATFFVRDHAEEPGRGDVGPAGGVAALIALGDGGAEVDDALVLDDAERFFKLAEIACHCAGYAADALALRRGVCIVRWGLMTCARRVVVAARGWAGIKKLRARLPIYGEIIWIIAIGMRCIVFVTGRESAAEDAERHELAFVGSLRSRSFGRGNG